MKNQQEKRTKSKKTNKIETKNNKKKRKKKKGRKNFSLYTDDEDKGMSCSNMYHEIDKRKHVSRKE